MKKILAVFLLLAGIAAAQTYGSFSGVVTGPTGIPVANASVTICHAGAVIIGTDCAQKATIYSSSAGGALANPLTTNANGEFTFYAPPGDYTYSWNGNLYRASVMMAGNPVVAGLTIGSGPAMTSAPGIAWGFALPTGSFASSANYVSPMTAISAITIKRFQFNLQTAEAGCTTNGAVYLYDVTASANLVSISLTNGTALYDSGGISINFPAGHELMVMTSKGTGCTTEANNGSGTVQYQMQ